MFKFNKPADAKAMAGKQKGFTLLELLVVIGIIGLLASIVVVNLTGARKRARDTKRVGDIKAIQTALEGYYGKNGKYPDSINSMVGNTAELPKRPLDPIAAVSTICSDGTQSDACYFYAVHTPTGAAGPQFYHLGASLEETGSMLLNQDIDCNSAAGGTSCPAGTAYTNGFNGDVSTGCGITADRYCYDVAQ